MKPLGRKIVGLFSQTLKSTWYDEFPARMFQELAGEILRAINSLFVRTRERWLQCKRSNLKNGQHPMPMKRKNWIDRANIDWVSLH